MHLFTINNDQTSAIVTGLAYERGSPYCVPYWISIVGPKSRVSSIWATFISKGKRCIIREVDSRGFDSFPASTKRFVAMIDKATSYQNVIIRPRAMPELLLYQHPGKTIHELTDDEKAAAKAAIHAQFIDYINSHTNTIVLPEWAGWLYERATTLNAMNNLLTEGDCIYAAVVRTDFNWPELVKLGFEEGKLSF